MKNVPNILTVARLILLPFIIALFFLEDKMGVHAMWSALFLYVIAAITDFLDGWVARKYNIISPFGTFMDPISDKIFVATLLIVFVAFGRLDGIWIIPVVAILGREFLVSGLREYLGPHNVKMPVSQLAKWKTAIQMLSLGFLIIGPYIPYGLDIGQSTLIIAAIITVVTGAQYLKVGLEHMRKMA